MAEKNIVPSRIASFISEDIWRIHLGDISKGRALLIHLLRVVILAGKGFIRDNCYLRASSLTFYSMLSIVPVAAMAFGVAKGFGFEKRLEAEILEKIPGHEEILIQVVGAARSFIENTKGGVIAGIGVVVLFWTVIKVLGQIEASFNYIWKVEKARSFPRKFADYLSIMLIGPLLFIMSGSATVFITTYVTSMAKDVDLVGFFSPMLFTGIKMLPYMLIWLLFTIVYILMPNTKVRWASGLLAGVAAGTMYQILQWVYLTFQIGVARYNAIYGSFAALPLFLIWLQFSWLVVLLGAEICYAFQNAGHYEYESDIREMSLHHRRLFSLRVLLFLVRNFANGRPAANVEDISTQLKLPERLVESVLEDLASSGAVSMTASNDSQVPGYQPARDIGSLTVADVLLSIEQKGINRMPLPETKETDALLKILDGFWENVSQSKENRLLKDI